MAIKKTPPEPCILDTTTVSQETLDKTPARLLELMRGIGTRPAIFAGLKRRGYDEREHARGWSLIHDTTGFVPVPTEASLNTDTVEAIAELDQLDDDTHALVDASLKHRAPTVRAALLDGIEPGTGADSVIYFDKLLKRLDQLQSGALVGVDPTDAKVAITTLAARGFGGAQRKHLATVVARAQSASEEGQDQVDAARKKMEVALRAARAFYDEWAAIARIEVTRRDHLILLGLASRKTQKSKAKKRAAAPVAPASTPAPPAPTDPQPA